MSQIPEIIDNRKYLLKDVINKLIKNSTKVRIAAGYFYLNGFDIVKDNISQNCQIDIVIGTETDLLTARAIDKGYKAKENVSKEVIDIIKNSMKDIDDNQKDRIYGLSEMIKNGQINFKIYTKDKFHSKAYIFDVEYNQGEIKDKYAIIGSSNFTKRGLGAETVSGSNTELNAVLRQPSAVTEVKRWFNDIWNDSEEFNVELLNIINSNLRFETLKYTPFDIILKSLYTLYKDDKTFNKSQLNLDGLTEFQEFAVHRSISILERYNGVIIADSVGLGKTYIAIGLLEYFVSNDYKVLIICPASLREMWKNVGSKFDDAEIKVKSQESIGMSGLDYNEIDQVNAIIIDEAHNFRNDNTSRFKELVKVTYDKKIVQLTATPINNSVFDLYNIMTLFVREDEFKDKGITKLQDVFSDYENNKDKVNTVLSEIMIRRSRRFIRKKYGKGKDLIVDGKKAKFPKRNIFNVNYNLSDVYGSNIYDEISSRLENLYLPVISTEDLSEKQEAIIIGLIKKTFLKRFESSVYSFKRSIKKQQQYCKSALDGIKQGYLLCKKEFIESGIDFDLDTDIKDYPQIPISQYTGDVEVLTQNLLSDLADFNYILSIVEGITPSNDDKIQTLIRLLNGKLHGKKVLVFTEFKDTAVYLYNNIKDKVDGIVEEIDSDRSKKGRKERIIKRFAPHANKIQSIDNEIDILISTDVLAEGQNLQDCNIIINYDLPWNPVRIIQREGRIDRLTTKHDNIYIYNFMPEDSLESLLNLVDRINQKIKYINETVGQESKILSEKEKPSDKVFNDPNEENTDAARKMKDEKNAGIVLDKIEEQQEEFMPSEEYMRDDYVTYILQDESNQKRASNLPNGIYSIRNTGQYKGVFMYYKCGDDNYWLYYDCIKNDFMTNKALIYKIISYGHHLNVKPLKIKPNFDVGMILKKGKNFVKQEVKKAMQGQHALGRVDRVQLNIGVRVKQLLISPTCKRKDKKQLMKILRLLKRPLHKGIILKLKSFDLDGISDDELIFNLKTILKEIDTDSKKNTKSNDEDIKLVCYELFV